MIPSTVKYESVTTAQFYAFQQ